MNDSDERLCVIWKLPNELLDLMLNFSLVKWRILSLVCHKFAAVSLRYLFARFSCGCEHRTAGAALSFLKRRRAVRHVVRHLSFGPQEDSGDQLYHIIELCDVGATIESITFTHGKIPYSLPLRMLNRRELDLCNARIPLDLLADIFVHSYDLKLLHIHGYRSLHTFYAIPEVSLLTLCQLERLDVYQDPRQLSSYEESFFPTVAPIRACIERACTHITTITMCFDARDVDIVQGVISAASNALRYISLHLIHVSGSVCDNGIRFKEVTQLTCLRLHTNGFHHRFVRDTLLGLGSFDVMSDIEVKLDRCTLGRDDARIMSEIILQLHRRKSASLRFKVQGFPRVDAPSAWFRWEIVPSARVDDVSAPNVQIRIAYD